MAFGKPRTPLTPEEQLQRRQNLGVGLAALSETLQGGDPVARTLGLQQQFEQQEQQAEQERLQAERQKSLEALAQTNPELAKMYELFGEKGLQQAYLRKQEQREGLAASQQQIQRLRGAKFSDQEVNLILAGAEIKDVLDLRQTGISDTQIIKNIEENVQETVKETDILDTFANLDQAFGPVDALQEGMSQITRKMGFDIDEKTSSAVRARNSLNTEILANLAADFTGRPNVLIYENLKANLPMGAATSHADAREKYENVKDQVDARIKNLKQGIQSSIVSDANKEKYREELNKSLLLSQKLDSAILSLKGKKEETLQPSDFGVSGKYQNLYLDNG